MDNNAPWPRADSDKPVRTPGSVRGKYKGLVEASIEELEESGDRFITAAERGIELGHSAGAISHFAEAKEIVDELLRDRKKSFR